MRPPFLPLPKSIMALQPTSLESIEGGEKWARYSFLGSGSPVVVYEDRGDLLVVQGTRKKRIPSCGNPLERLREMMDGYRPVTVPDLPPFVGGAVGYLSYDMVRTFEDLAAGRRTRSIFRTLPSCSLIRC